MSWFWHRTRMNLKNQCCGKMFSSSSSSSSSFPPPIPNVVPARPLPPTGETHLWYLLPDEVTNASLLNHYLDVLPPCEKHNVHSMHGDHLKKRALLARALVRTTIARYQITSHVSPRSLKFRKNVYGKPEVDWQRDGDWSPPPLHFNISHTSSLIVCGVTNNVQIGLDVEEKQRTTKNDVLSFAQRYFSPTEVKHLATISDPEIRRQGFIKLWTLKEAYVKALGRGFSAAPFKTFSIRARAATPFHNFDSEGYEIFVDSNNDSKDLTRNWQFTLLELAHSHYAAICTEKVNSIRGGIMVPTNLRVWKTIPFVEDEYVSGTNAVIKVDGFA